MAERDQYRFIGKGVYGVPEAARITDVPAARIRRWLMGYQRTGIARRPPVLRRAYDLVDDRLALSFLDLVEVRIVNAFLRHGMRWRTLWEAHQKARSMVGHDHPFATGTFRTDGRKVFEALAGEGEATPRVVLDILRDQLNFSEIVAPYFKNIDFATDRVGGALRWWPLGQDRNVVIDPQRSFGQAVVAREGVPTLVLARAFAAEGSIPRVAKWFAVRSEAVSDAVEWETRLANAA